MANGLFISAFRGPGSPGVPGVGAVRTGLAAAGQAETIAETGRIGLQGTRDTARLQSIFQGAQILKGIQDPQKKLEFLIQRKEQLEQSNLPANDTDEAIALAQQGRFPELAELTDQAIAIGQQLGQRGGIQQAVPVPGIGFAGLTRQGEARLIELPEEDQIRVREALEADARRKAEAAGLKTQATLQAELATKPEIEASIVESKGEAEVLTPLGKIRLADATAEQIQSAKDLSAKKFLINSDADSAIGNIDKLLQGDLFKRIYGAIAGRTPTITQDSLDAEALRDQLVGLLSLDARQKLKGQGTISDAEFKILANSVGVLSNPLISNKLAKEELNRVKLIFQSAKNRVNTGNLIEVPGAAITPQAGAPVTPAGEPELAEGDIIVNRQTQQRQQVVNGILVDI